MDADIDYLLTEIDVKLTGVRKWWGIIWWTHMWFVAIGYVFALLVPFGLAALLYLPDQQRSIVNIMLIFFSAASLILPVVTVSMRFPERQRRLRMIDAELSADFARFKTGKGSHDELLDAYEKARKDHAQKETA